MKVFLIDDHASFRQPLAFMLNREPDLEVVTHAGTMKEARALMDAPADIVLIDLHLPDGNGLELIEEIHSRQPDAAMLVLTATNSRGEIARAVELGAAGVLHKSAAIPEIVEGVRRVGQGEHLLKGPEAVELMRAASREREDERKAQARLSRLTPREYDVLRSLARGLSDKEIAAQLHVSTETVRTHMVNILSKLEVESRLQALVFALRFGAVEID